MNDYKKNQNLGLLFILLGLFLVSQLASLLNKDVKAEVGWREVQDVEFLDLLWSTPIRIDRPLSGKCGDSSPSRMFMQLDVPNQQIIAPVLDQKIPFFPRVYLTGLDLDTGQISWRTLLDTTLYAIGGNSNSIVVVERNHTPPTASCSPNLDYCEAVKIVSYDILTRDVVWSKLQSNMRAASVLCVSEDIVSIIGDATRSTYHEEVTLNANTGEKIPFQDLFLYVTEEEVRLNRQIIHELGIDESELRGGFVVEGKYLFVLTSNDKTLRIINRETSELVGKAEFGGEPFEGANYFTQFKIVTDNDYVIVYLADSQQIFVFRLLE